MIQVDDREGSRDLADYIKNGTLVQVTRLNFGDAALTGSGPGERPVPVGIEIKSVGDLIRSIHDGRLVGHQLPGLKNCYENIWLVVEGHLECGPSGELITPWGKTIDTPRGAIKYNEISRFLITLTLRANINIWFTKDRAETAQFIVDLHGWWTGKDWDQHHAHLHMYQPPPKSPFLRKPRPVEIVAAVLPDIGWTKARSCGEHFPNPISMFQASRQEWQEVPGIGKTIAEKVWKFIRGEK